MTRAKDKVQTRASQMISGWFGGMLDAFLGFAQRKQFGFRGPTPERAKTRKRGKTGILPFHIRKGYEPKPPSRRDKHRAAVAARA